MMFDLKKIDRSNRLETIKKNVMKVSPKQRVFNNACEIADLVLEKESKYASMSDAELKNLSYRIMDEINGDENILNNYLVDGLAIAREMIFRVHGLKAFRVQIIGAIVVHFGDFSEMATGEGKTLVLLLVSYVNALSKRGVHIVTVNEYLVERDAEFSRKALSKLGISVGFVTSSMDHEVKKSMYNCDITYVSNSELGFDYLRDNMVTNINDKLIRELFFAIVDEADSVLIDEARTPLIIAGEPQDDVTLYEEVDTFVKSLEPSDYVIDLETQAINLNDRGIKKAEQHFKIDNLYDIENSVIVHKIMNSLKANYMMELGREYIVRRNPKKGVLEIALVDTFTGRIMDGRMYSAGLHQAIQAKEKVLIEPENLTVATITYQSFFRLYKKLSGVSGTALTEKNELLNIYNMVVVDIPTNKPKKRIDYPDYIFATKQLKWKYVAAEIKKRHATGQPILVGTVSVEDSELLHKMLDKIGIPHKVLNAKNHAEEAKIIATAGQMGSVTIATNMAGRGTDIKLGPGVAEIGGLYVLGTERNESRRIDNQLRGRSGRQGDPGESRFFISLQDLIFKRFATDIFDKAQYKLGEDVIDLKFFSRLLNKTQKKIENTNFDIRKNLIDYDYVLSEQRELFYKQRDVVLISDNIIEIVFRMIPRIVDVLLTVNRSSENIDMIDFDSLLTDIEKKCGIKLDLDKKSMVRKTIPEIFDYLDDTLKRIIYKRYKSLSKEMANEQWRKIIISAMDTNWTIFLDKIQKLRDNVGLRSFEQKSPLNIYIEDSDRLFYNIIINIANETIFRILAFGDNELNDTNIINNSTDDTKPTTINNSIDDIPLSIPLVKDNKDKLENDKINSGIKESTMSNRNNSEKVISVVDEILSGTKSNTSQHENKILNDSLNSFPASDQRQSNVPPPIPKQTAPSSTSTKTSSSDDFMSQVLDVIDKDINPKQVDIDFDGIANGKDNNVEVVDAKPIKIDGIGGTYNQQTNKSNPNTTSSSYEPSRTNYLRTDDSTKYDDYKPRHSRPLQMNDDDLNKKLIDKERQALNNAHNIVNDAKDQEIKNLKDKLDEINAKLLQREIEQEKEISHIVNNENTELKKIHDMLLNAIKEQDNFYKEQQQQLAKIKEQEARERMENEIRNKIKQEQHQFLEQERQRQAQERERQDQIIELERQKLEEERNRILMKEQELLEKEKAFTRMLNGSESPNLSQQQNYQQQPTQKVLYNKYGVPLRRVDSMVNQHQQFPGRNTNAPDRVVEKTRPSILSNSYVNRVNELDYDDDTHLSDLSRATRR